MLSIRLSRQGKKHQPSYRVIVVDKRKDPWGSYIENLGFYDPSSKPKIVQFKIDRIKYWLSKGAKATPTIWNLLVDQKAVQGTKMKATVGHKIKKEEVAPAPAAKPAEGKAASPAKAEEKPAA